jgi:hypothetical protein
MTLLPADRVLADLSRCVADLSPRHRTDWWWPAALALISVAFMAAVYLQFEIRAAVAIGDWLQGFAMGGDCADGCRDNRSLFDPDDNSRGQLTVDQLAAQAIRAEIDGARATEATVQLAIANPDALDVILDRWNRLIKVALDGEALSTMERTLANAPLFVGRRRMITQVLDSMAMKGDEGLSQAIEKFKDPKYTTFLATDKAGYSAVITQHLQTVARDAANERRTRQDAIEVGAAGWMP